MAIVARAVQAARMMRDVCADALRYGLGAAAAYDARDLRRTMISPLRP